MLTSGKVPFEKTLQGKRSASYCRGMKLKADSRGDLHQQTGLTAGTIAYDDKLAADLGHLERQGSSATNQNGRSRG
jgi:hypothetical protein